jgi:hypothetical protein
LGCADRQSGTAGSIASQEVRMSFAQSGFAQFMASPAGRIARIVVGLFIIWWGYHSAGPVVVVVGLVLLLAGAFDFCVITGLFGGVWSGKGVRGSKPSP